MSVEKLLNATSVLVVKKVEIADTPGSVRMDDILYIAFEKEEKDSYTDVLIEEMLGLIKDDSDETPGPVNTAG